MAGQGDPKKACKLLGIEGDDMKVVINAFKNPKALKLLGTDKKKVLAKLSEMSSKKLKVAAVEKQLEKCGITLQCFHSLVFRSVSLAVQFANDTFLLLTSEFPLPLFPGFSSRVVSTPPMDRG